MARHKLVVILWSVLVLTGMLVMSGCTQERKYRIGISQCSSDDWRSKMNEEIMREVMFHDNVEVEIRSAEDSNERQIADLDYFVANGFDLIAVAPNEADALTPKIKEIYQSGKPIIVFDRTVNGDFYTAFQGADNEEIGSMAATVAGNMTDGNPRILEIRGLKGSSPAELRNSGFKHFADSMGYQILGQAYGNWNYEDAKRVADSLLTLYPSANVFYCHNDRMALGAWEVAHGRGRDDIKIIGIDAAPSIGIKAVEEGKIDATFLYPTDGHQLTRTALAILQGGPYDKYLTFPTPAPVDISNADILQQMDRALREETNKIGELQSKMLTFSERYSMQTSFLQASIVIILLLAVLIFIIMRFYWIIKQHHRQMKSRNEDLERQRNELDKLYQQLQEATGSKLTFFTNVSHDLRTPLTLIADPVNQLADADNLTPRQHTLMQLASKNVKRLQRLINQILDIRKYDNGALKLNLVNVNISEAVKEWAAPFAEIAVRRHIKFSTSIPPSPGITTAVDIEKTERILFNLLSNAFKFTPENGAISVSLDSDGTNVVIKVADTGIGIPPEDLKNIFERFFKTDKINPNGSGIGLALSKVFIDMHGGSISVESNEGKGSVFTVKLPIRSVEDSAEVSAFTGISDVAEIEEVEDENIDIPEDTRTLLVIDDNKDICTLIKNVMSDHYTIITAFSGAQGIRLASRYIPDLIICDVMMPGMSGYEVCRSLKKEAITAHIPVLMLTACSRDEQRIEGYECGADAFMTKPFDAGMLMARCKSLLDNRRLIYENFDAKPMVESRVPATASAGKSPAGVSGDDILDRFMAIVDKELANSDLSVEYIADKLGLSRVQLYRKIKALTNYSVAELIRSIRLKKAAILLKTTTGTVSEIAYAVGFASPSYFSRSYKEYFNESPVDTQNRTSKAR